MLNHEHIVRSRRRLRPQIAFIVGIGVIVLLFLLINPGTTASPSSYRHSSLFLESIKKCIILYAKDHGAAPKGNATEVVSVLVDQGYLHMAGHYYGPDGKVVDGWSNPIVVTSHNGKLIVYSYGPNGEDNGGDQDGIAYVVDLAEISADEAEKQ